MKLDEKLERKLGTNNHGVYTEPFKFYWITHEKKDGDTPILACRVRNGWEAWNNKFVTYNQFILSAKPATKADLVQAGIKKASPVEPRVICKILKHELTGEVT